MRRRDLPRSRRAGLLGGGVTATHSLVDAFALPPISRVRHLATARTEPGRKYPHRSRQDSAPSLVTDCHRPRNVHTGRVVVAIPDAGADHVAVVLERDLAEGPRGGPRARTRPITRRGLERLRRLRARSTPQPAGGFDPRDAERRG